MQYIVLIGEGDLTLDSVKRLEHYGTTSSHDVPGIEERYWVNYGDDYIYYDYEVNLANEYEAGELDVIPFKSPSFIVMSYSSEERLLSILRQDNFLKGIYVDDDYGNIVPIEEFIARFDEFLGKRKRQVILSDKRRMNSISRRPYSL